MSKPIVLLAGVVGILFVIAGVIYLLQPAQSLPHFFPGYDAELTRHHYKHGIGMLILAAGCFVFAWFQSGKKLAPPQEQNTQ